MAAKVVLALLLSSASALRPQRGVAARVRSARDGTAPAEATAAASVAPVGRAAAAAALSALLVLQPTASFAGVCDYAPTSDLCVAEKAREARGRNRGGLAELCVAQQRHVAAASTPRR